ncbi:hypothetical protein MXMO3_03499 (plasmid) [Maritalea myrionectae]|uniref:DUF736 domain-containing protein n=1 Tax=Maritalea myrionectae TaxID=454601 RepID=A0A2R4MJ48_9HYPH|nr:DUF736 family protein [Maritalea myrionectae]AVX06002.1 hypothetical protein MXMO3_03499 [Maritalea myrionectae]
MTNEPNIIRFETAQIEGTKGKGRLATLTFDENIFAEPVTSDNEKAPTHQLFANSPRGARVQIGAIWKRKNKEDKPYFQVSIPQLNFRANLGKAAGQDEDEVQAIIPWNS